jgi:hypothetical protein
MRAKDDHGFVHRCQERSCLARVYDASPVYRARCPRRLPFERPDRVGAEETAFDRVIDGVGDDGAMSAAKYLDSLQWPDNGC